MWDVEKSILDDAHTMSAAPRPSTDLANGAQRPFNVAPIPLSAPTRTWHIGNKIACTSQRTNEKQHTVVPGSSSTPLVYFLYVHMLFVQWLPQMTGKKLRVEKLHSTKAGHSEHG